MLGTFDYSEDGTARMPPGQEAFVNRGLSRFSFFDESDAKAHGPTSSQLTPPETPQMNNQVQVEGSELESGLESNGFPNFLRAFYHYHPASTITSDDGDEASVTVPINQGDVILVHSIQPNGWADGTLLASGARGWLPTNYCENYDDHKIRNLLESLMNVWEFIRGHEDDDPTVFVRQDYVRGMIAGIRVLLERTGCLTRDAPLVKNAFLVRRTRRTILGELSGFVKAGKRLQEMCCTDISSDVLFDLLDEVVLKAFRVVTKAVKFLDVWTQHFQASHGNNMQDDTPPLTPAATNEMQSVFTVKPLAGEGDGVQDVKSTNRASVVSSSERGSLGPLAGPVSPVSPLSPSAGLLNRPTSLISQKRISACHRLSSTPKSPVLRKGCFASERLSATHDAFLGNLGAFLSLHLESRSPCELMKYTNQARRGYRALMDVVNEIVTRDHRHSQTVESARAAFESNIDALNRVAQFTCDAAEGTEEAFLVDSQTPVLEAATLCVRSAGEYVSQAKNIIERVGDFEIDDDFLGLGITHVLESSMAGQVEPQAAPSISEDFELVEKPLPSPPVAPSPPSDLEKYNIVMPTTPTVWPPPHRDSLAPIQESLPRVSSDTVRRTTSAASDTTFVGQQPSPLDLDISPTSPVLISSIVDDDPDEHGQGLHPETSFDSLTDSTDDRLSSFRASQESFESEASTQATTPDQSPVRDSFEQSLKDSFGSLSESRSTLVDDSEDTENELLTTAYAHELTFNKEGQVTGGSLPALVERLTTHDSTPDALFVNTFYLTFRLFCAPAEFAQCLADRYDFVSCAPAIASPVRLRIYNVVKGWLELHWHFDTDGEALDIIVDLAKAMAAYIPSASKKIFELAEQAKRNSLRGKETKVLSLQGKTNTIIGSSVDMDAPLPSPVVSRGQLNLLKKCELRGGTCSILDFDPLELARQFTLMESKIFCKIIPEELLAQEWMKKAEVTKAVHVKAMSALSTDLANLVADTILQPEEPKRRALILKQWVKIAKKCRELNNYDSLLAIVCSLNSSMVSRLKKTWSLVAPKTLARLEELRSIVDCSRNYANLRSLLQNHVAPCIPFVGIYLTDLTFVDVGNQTRRQLPRGMRTMSYAGNIDLEECISVINFDKHVKTAKIIGDLQRFQIPYRLSPVSEMQEWMEGQIRRVRTSDQANLQTFYRRSLLLEPRDASAQKLSPELPINTSFSSTTSGGSAKDKESQSTRGKFEMWTSLHFTNTIGNKEKVIS